MTYPRLLFTTIRSAAILFVFIVGMVSIVATGGSDSSSGGGGSNDVTDPYDSRETRPEYLPGTAASTAASHESTSDSSVSGEGLTLTLGDQTRVEISPLDHPYEALLESASLSADAAAQRIADELDLEAGLIPTGALRQLTVSGMGDPSELRPVITIPAHETGTINPATINVLRIGDIYVDGTLQRDFVMMLPVATDSQGNLTFIDPLMREAASAYSMPGNLRSQILAEGSQNGGVNSWEASARYVAMSFQGNLNWNRPPYLIRMIPDPGNSASGYRRPATSEELAELARKPVCNVVLLVHGHVEEEKGGGSVGTTEQAPWLFQYKRIVWDLLYQEIAKTESTDDGEKAVYPYECTAFYEFIYPTYRPIFSEVVDGTGTRHETLGAALGVMIQQEMVKDPQLRKMIQNDMPFNTFIFAHSQGGLIARAGLRQMPQEFKDRMARYVSWGTPHHGAALYTLRYGLQSGYDMVIEGRRLPLQAINDSSYWGSIYLDGLDQHLAIDAPGIRDLRWQSSLQNMLRMDELFPDIPHDFLLPVSMYSQNLTAFNANTSREEIPGGYTFIAGTTSKRVNFDFDNAFEAYYFIADSTNIERGATLNDYIMRDFWERVNDGAVPIYSQEAAGVTFSSPSRVLELLEVDHEEFFGAKPGQRTPEALARGRMTARETLSEARMQHPSRGCPEIEASMQFEADTAQISGTVSFPLYDENHGGRVSQGIERIEARRDNQDGRVIDAFSFTHEADGSFQGVSDADDLPDGDIVIVAVFKDDSEIVGELETFSVFILPPRILLLDLQDGATEYSDTFEASGRPEGHYQFEWDFGDGTTHKETRQPGERSQVSHTFTGLMGGETFRPTVRLLDMDDNLLAEDTIVIYVEGEDETIDCGWEVPYSQLTRRESDDGRTVYYTNSAGAFHGPYIQYRYDGGISTYTCYYNQVEHGYIVTFNMDGIQTAQWQNYHGKQHGLSLYYDRWDDKCLWQEYEYDEKVGEGSYSGNCNW